MDERFGFPTLPAPPAAAAPRVAPRASRRRRTIAAVVALVVIADAALLVRTIEQQRSIARLSDAVASARQVEASLGAHIGAVDDAQASAASAIDGLFDPETVVERSRSSVFTLMAGPWQGSAFVISDGDGSSELITNFHVVRTLWTRGQRRVAIRNADTSYHGVVVKTWPGADLAIIRVRAELTPLEAESSSIVVGEPIVVLGSPYGYAGTVSTGVVSATRGRLVQFSAPVSPGSSGGPILDAEGRVIGVTTSKVEARGAEGLSFAIPIWLVCRLTEAC